MVKISMIPNQILTTIKCSQNDTSLRKWEFQLYANDVILHPSGQYNLLCDNGANVLLVQDGDLLICDCTEQLSTKSGKFLCKIKNTDGNEISYSSLFILNVEVKP